MLVAELREKYKYAGLEGALKHLGYHLANRVMYFDCLHTMTLELGDIAEKYLVDAPDGMDMRFLTPAEVRAFSKNPDYDLDEPFIEESLANGDRCLAILDGDILASYGWYAKGPTKVTGEFNLNFTSDWVYMFRGYTNPAYRGKRLHAIGMARAAKIVTEEGYKGLTSIVASTNAASLKSVVRLGYKLTGRIYLAARLNHYFAFHNSGAKAAETWVTSRREGPKVHLLNLPDAAHQASVTYLHPKKTRA